MKISLKQVSLTATVVLVLPMAAFGQTNYATPYSFTTLAGSAGLVGSANGTGNAARFRYPRGVAVDTNGIVYVADTINNTIRKVTPAGAVTTLAAGFNQPYGVAVDTNGTVYVADSNNHKIRKVTPAGAVTTLAGSGFIGSIDGSGTAAEFYYPDALAVDKAGNVYVADTFNHTIRKITPAGVVTTFAGSSGNSGSANGIGSAAQFYQPYGIAVHTNGIVYVADTGNNTIRKVTAAGVVTTLAGTAGMIGSTDGTGPAVRFNQPYGIAVDTNGNVYVTDKGNQTIRKVTPLGVVTTLAGVAGSWGSTNGPGNVARLSSPAGLAVDRAGIVYVADEQNCTIRKGSLVPFVEFTANTNLGGVPLVVQFTCPATDNVGNAITNWNWTFGDGSTSTAQNPSHTYSAAGTYQPSLLLTNSSGQAVAASGPRVTAVAYFGLVLNGGFESGSFFGWTLAGQEGLYNLVNTFNQSTEGMQPHAPSSYYARLGQVGSLGYLSQTLATSPGAKYLLSFWLNSPDGLTPNQFLASWNGSQIYSTNNLPRFGNDPAIAWRNFQFTVTATTSATILQFGFRDEPTALGLDDVRVQFVAQSLPGLTGISLSGTDLILNGTNGLSGGNYVVLMSTNVAQPLSQWTRIATNVLGAAGNFSISATNAVDSGDPQRFYRLQMQ